MADQSRQVSCRSGAPLLEARLHHPAIHPQQWYAPFPQVALGDWPPNARVYVALDTTALTPFVLICASLIYRGRAIPLAWRAMQHRSTKVAFEDYQPVLEQVDTKPYDAGQGWAVLVTEKTEANEIWTFKSRSLAPGQGDTP